MNYIKSLSIALVLLPLILFSSCGDSSQNTKEVKSYEGTSSKEEVQVLFDSYLALKDALVASDFANTKNKAEDFSSKVAQIKTQDETLKALANDANKIAQAEDINSQRDYLNTLSDNLLSILKATEGKESTVYRQYCPMAFDNTGAYWLSNSKDIENPYFGDQMLKCGKVVETIN